METTANRTGAAIDFLVVAGAVSAGVHAGLAPEHLHGWLPLGASFVAAAAAAALGVAALVLRPASVWPPRALGAALPPLDPDREPVDLLGVCTSALEAAGFVAAYRLVLAYTPGGTA
jgi:hypothetical protein